MEDILPKPTETVDGLQRFDRGLPQAEEKENMVSELYIVDSRGYQQEMARNM